MIGQAFMTPKYCLLKLKIHRLLYLILKGIYIFKIHVTIPGEILLYNLYIFNLYNILSKSYVYQFYNKNNKF